MLQFIVFYVQNISVFEKKVKYAVLPITANSELKLAISSLGNNGAYTEVTR